MFHTGKLLLISGLVIAAIGGLMMLSGKISLPGNMPGLFRLPGDIVIQKKNFAFYFPLATSILLSLLLTLLFWLFGRR